MNIKLMSFEENDIPNLIRWVPGPGASDLWASRTYPYPLSELMVSTHLQKADRRPVELRVYKVVVEGSAEPVGHVELDHFDHQVQSVRISRLFISPEYRKCGVAQQAVEQLLKKCFIELNLNRIEVYALESNYPALRLYEKLGFRQEGFLRENMVLNGIKQGSFILSLLKSDGAAVNFTA
ncbi:MAG TPA: GNAT family protein [Bacteriovoracaceae bacterium]|nr:GNAT family protein [Bacteriovoracaceae bacterium]